MVIRYVVSALREREAGGDQEHGSRSVGEPGLSGELQETRPKPSPGHPIPRLQDRFSLHGDESPQREGSVNSAGSTESPTEEPGISKTTRPHDRDFLIHNPSSVTCPTTLQGLSILETSSPQTRQLQLDHADVQGGSGRPGLVDYSSLEDERAAPSERPALSGDHNGCIPPGLGAHCQDGNIADPWMAVEKLLQINCLELLGATHAIKAFCRERREMMIHLRLDNSTAIAYINHLGGTRSSTLCSIATDLWSWCLDRKLFLLASHVPGVQNTLADHLSRSVVDRHDWILNRSVFKKLDTRWCPLVVDLKATVVLVTLTGHHNHGLQHFSHCAWTSRG